MQQLQYHHQPVFHAKSIHIQDTIVVASQDMADFMTEPLSFLLVHLPLCTDILQLVCCCFQAVLQLLILEKKLNVCIYYMSTSTQTALVIREIQLLQQAPVADKGVQICTHNIITVEKHWPTERDILEKLPKSLSKSHAQCQVGARVV